MCSHSEPRCAMLRIVETGHDENDVEGQEDQG